jgi:hypothetical protein
MDARPGGPAAKREPSPEGLRINPEDDLSAVGAALNLGPLAPLSLGPDPDFPLRGTHQRPRARLSVTKAVPAGLKSEAAVLTHPL